jgi:hypothetical protein
MNAFVVWSERDGGWLGSGAGWYIASLMRAGLYSEADARSIAGRANQYLPPGVWHEWPMADPLGRTI